MTNFIKVINNKVVNIIVAEQDFINTLPDKDFYIKEDITRKNYSVNIGFTYDKDRDAFIAPKPFPSWTLNEDTCNWEAPVVRPDDGKRYSWNEETTSWDEIDE